jgi:hypothetical protein
MNRPTKTITIESGIPLAPNFKKKGSLTLMMLDMKPGESFVVNSNRERGTVLRINNKKFGVKMASRKQPDQGYRCWRVS